MPLDPVHLEGDRDLIPLPAQVTVGDRDLHLNTRHLARFESEWLDRTPLATLLAEVVQVGVDRDRLDDRALSRCSDSGIPIRVTLTGTGP